MGIVHQSVEDGVGHGGIADLLMPVFDRELAGHQGGAKTVSILQDLQEIMALILGEQSQAIVVKHQEIGLGQRSQNLDITTVALGQGQVGKEPGDPHIEDVAPFPAGLVGKGAGQVGFADAGGTGDQQIQVLGDPTAIGELVNHGAVELPGRFQVMPGRLRIILDVAHNPQAVAGLAANLDGMEGVGRTIAVVGMLADKDIAGALAALRGKIDLWLLAGLDVPRGASVETLAGIVAEADLGGNIERFASPLEAFAQAVKLADDNDRILVFGSFYTVAAVLREMKNRS